jgi:hypothetical protein
MSKISLAPDASGTGIFTIASPNSNTNRTLTLPDDTGTLALAGAVPDKIEEGDSKVEVTDAGTGKVEITVDNVEVADFTTGAIVFNETGANQDFRVEGDTDADLLFVDASADRVGISTNAPDASLTVDGIASFGAGSASTPSIARAGDLNTGIFFPAADTIAFAEGGAEAMRIDSSGNLLVGQTAKTNASNGIALTGAGNSYFTATSTYVALFNRLGTDGEIFFFQNDTTNVGSISVSGASTAYNTSSDYRLKENVAPMTGALAKVLELNPVTYTWKINGSVGEGFIAHELQAVCPDAVTGVKDETEIQQIEVSPAVPATYDEEGNELTPAVEAVYEEREAPKHQGVDTSFLVATLTAAIQELSAKNDALEARIAALEGQ